MSGDSNYGGNGSIHWEIRHTNIAQEVDLKQDIWWNKPTLDKTAHHWFRHEHKGVIVGRDPIRVAPTGVEVADQFTVGLRYYVDAITDPAATVAKLDLGPIVVAARAGMPAGTGSAAAVAAALAAVPPTAEEVVLAQLEALIVSATKAKAAITNGGKQADVAARVPVLNREEPPKQGWEVNVKW